MRAQNWTDVMTLLAVMVAADKQDEAAELSLFRRAALNLRDVFAPNIKLTESFAADWLSENRDDINRQATSVHFDSSVKRLKNNLGGLPNKSAILMMIMKSVMADNAKGAADKLRFTAERDENEWMLEAA